MGRRLFFSRPPLLQRIRSDCRQSQAGGRARQSRAFVPLFHNKGCVCRVFHNKGCVLSRGVARASVGADSKPARLPAV